MDAFKTPSQDSRWVIDRDRAAIFYLHMIVGGLGIYGAPVYLLTAMQWEFLPISRTIIVAAVMAFLLGCIGLARVALTVQSLPTQETHE